MGQVTPILHPRLGYVAGNSAFAAGYLVVLLISPLVGCAFGAWGARARPGSRRPLATRPWPAMKRLLVRGKPAT